MKSVSMSTVEIWELLKHFGAYCNLIQNGVNQVWRQYQYICLDQIASALMMEMKTTLWLSNMQPRKH